MIPLEALKAVIRCDLEYLGREREFKSHAEFMGVCDYLQSVLRSAGGANTSIFDRDVYHSRIDAIYHFSEIYCRIGVPGAAISPPSTGDAIKEVLGEIP